MPIEQQQDIDFEEFAKRLLEQPAPEGQELSLQDAVDLWESKDEEARAIQEAINSYEAGERGRPVDEFLAERRVARAKKVS